MSNAVTLPCAAEGSDVQEEKAFTASSPCLCDGQTPLLLGKTLGFSLKWPPGFSREYYRPLLYPNFCTAGKTEEGTSALLREEFSQMAEGLFAALELLARCASLKKIVENEEEGFARGPDGAQECRRDHALAGYVLGDHCGCVGLPQLLGSGD